MTIDDLAQTIEQLEQMRPPPVEVWISRHAPDKDAEGNLTACKLPVKKPYLTGFLPETEEIIIMSESVFARLAADVFAVNIPVFRSGGVRVRLRSLGDYRQNEENPVAHTPRNLGAVVESIHKVGAGRSGLAKDGKMLAGNLTSKAMAEAGIEGVVEVTTDGTQWVVVNRPDLSPVQEKQAAYGDQQGSFLAGWELDQMLADVEAKVDLSGIIEDFELEDILGATLIEIEKQNGSYQEIQEQYLIIIELESESAQKEALEKLVAEGYTCRALLS